MELPVNVLYIEDDKATARLLQRRLMRIGYHVDIAPDGSAGIQQLRDHHYDVVVVDYNMPQMSGLEVVEHLANQLEAPPTIMLTGMGDEQVAVSAMKLGVTDYVIKDLDGAYIDLLPTIIQQAIQQQNPLSPLSEDTYAERAWLEREIELFKLIKGAGNGILLLNEREEIILFNATAQAIFGYLAEQVLGHPLDMLIPARFRAAHQGYVRNYRNNPGQLHLMGPERDEIVGLHKDGNEIPLEVSISRLAFQNLSGYMAVVNDLSQRKRTMNEFQQASLILSALSEAVITTDTNLAVSGLWNHGAEQMYGWKADEVLGSTLSDLLQTQVLENDGGTGRHELFTNGFWRGELVHTSKDGAAVNILSSLTLMRDEDGNPDRVIVVNRDITEQKKAQVPLAQNERLLHTILDGLLLQVVLVDEPGKILLANKAWRDFMTAQGVPSNLDDVSYLEVMAMAVTSVDAQDLDDGLRRIMDGKQNSFTQEVLVEADSGRKWFRMTARLVPGDRPRHIIITQEDIFGSENAKDC